MLLSNPASIEVEPVKPDSSVLGFSWAQKYFVMQTPSYQLTGVGAGTGLHPDLFGNPKGFGVIPSGGEYVIRIPGGRYLTPISEWGRPSIEVKADGVTLCSSDLKLSNREEYGFRMSATLPTGETVEKGEPYGPSPFDPHISRALIDISYTKSTVRAGRSFELDQQSVLVTDFVEALERVRIESVRTRFPLITYAADGVIPRIAGQFGPVNAEIRPPRHMGSRRDVQQRPDQDFIKSLRAWDWLEIEYPDCKLLIRCLTPENLHFGITAGEWHEDSRMRVDGKNLDVYWIHSPILLGPGEIKEFKYKFELTLI